MSSIAALAFAAPTDRSKPQVFGTEVSVVSVPTFVVDRDGHALRGLNADDFEVFEDGKRVPVVSFQYVDTTSPEDQERIRRAPAARRHFLFLFDKSFTNPAGLHRAQEAAHDFVRSKMADSDLGSVATFDLNRGIRVAANFTEDRALLSHAIETLGVPTLAHIGDPLNLYVQDADLQGEGATTRGDQTNEATSTPVLLALARRMRLTDEILYRNQIVGLLGSMNELAEALRGVEGRKQILYFSAGFDSKVLVGLSGSEAREDAVAITEGRIYDVDSDRRYGDTRLRDLFAAATKSLSSADCVVHSIDVTGLGNDGSLTQKNVAQDSLRDTSGRDSLSYMASETGGRFFNNANNLGAALGEILDMTSRYYILGYQSEAPRGPGTFHKLKVKVQRKGSRVSHRVGYYERLPRAAQTSMQRKFEAAQLVMTGVGLNNLHFSSLCLPFPTPGDRQTLGVVVQIPKGELAWQGGRPLALEVYGYAVAADGTAADYLAQLARIDTDQADPGRVAQGISFFGTFRIAPGKYTIKIMIQAPESGTAGVQFMDVTVPPYDPRQGFLLPPVLMDDSQRWLGLELGSNRSERIDSPFAVGGKPFLPRTSFRIAGGAPEKLVLIAYEPDRAQDPSAGIEIHSAFTDSHGASVAGGPIRIERVNRDGGGRRTYVLDYRPEGLVPGEYTLRIGIGESGAQLESYALLHVGQGVPVRQ